MIYSLFQLYKVGELRNNLLNYVSIYWNVVNEQKTLVYQHLIENPGTST